MKRQRKRIINEDCFAFKNSGTREYCKALTPVNSCVGCKFFKTEKELRRQNLKCMLRLSSLRIKERSGYGV